MAEQKKKLSRSRQNKMIGGVCAGIAEYIGVNANIVRLAYVILSVMSAAFPGILVYLAAWLLIPKEPVS